MIEVQVSHQDVDRLALYAAMGVPEIWHWRRERVSPLKLEDAKYVATDFSLAFPVFRPTQLERFLAMRHTVDETSLMLSYQDWIRTLPQAKV